MHRQTTNVSWLPISATGRGSAEPVLVNGEEDRPHSRRVVFKIRIKSLEERKEILAQADLTTSRSPSAHQYMTLRRRPALISAESLEGLRLALQALKTESSATDNPRGIASSKPDRRDYKRLDQTKLDRDQSQTLVNIRINGTMSWPDSRAEFGTARDPISLLESSRCHGSILSIFSWIIRNTRSQTRRPCKDNLFLPCAMVKGTCCHYSVARIRDRLNQYSGDNRLLTKMEVFRKHDIRSESARPHGRGIDNES